MCAVWSFPRGSCWPMIGWGFTWLAKVFHAVSIQVRELSTMRIVLTGASGQLGAYLLEALLETGHSVFPWSGHAAAKRLGLVLRPVDLVDEAAMLSALRASDPAVILH